MDIINNLSKSLTQGVERAKFEAEKFQRVARLQGELGDLTKQIDAKRMEAGDKALDLYRAGQITSATLGQLIRELDNLRTSATLKEDELKQAQGETFVDEQAPASPPPVQHVPVTHEPPRTTPAATGPQKFCAACGFQMPTTALFCPNCGARMTP